jgi:hypothetical protein
MIVRGRLGRTAPSRLAAMHSIGARDGSVYIPFQSAARVRRNDSTDGAKTRRDYFLDADGGGLRSSEHHGAVPCSRSDAAASSTDAQALSCADRGTDAPAIRARDGPPNLTEMVAAQPTDSEQTEYTAGVLASPVL